MNSERKATAIEEIPRSMQGHRRWNIYDSDDMCLAVITEVPAETQRGFIYSLSVDPHFKNIYFDKFEEAREVAFGRPAYMWELVVLACCAIENIVESGTHDLKQDWNTRHPPRVDVVSIMNQLEGILDSDRDMLEYGFHPSEFEVARSADARRQAAYRALEMTIEERDAACHYTQPTGKYCWTLDIEKYHQKLEAWNNHNK